MLNVMEEEILQQPAVCAGLFLRESRPLAAFVARLKKKPPPVILLTARGSSDHAAWYGRYLLELVTGIPVCLAAPSLLSAYKARPDYRHALAIGISQSGQGPDTAQVLRYTRQCGGLTLALTNAPASPLGQLAHHTLDLGAGPELSIAATKTYTAELAGLALFAALWSGRKDGLAGLTRMPDVMREVLDATQDRARRTAQRLRDLRQCSVLGRGLHLGNAHELALKLKECGQVAALSYSIADFQHGPITLASPEHPVILLGAPGPFEKERAVLKRSLRRRGAPVLDLALTSAYPGLYAPLASILPGQWLAFYTGLAKGLDPSQPRGIPQKVVKTL